MWRTPISFLQTWLGFFLGILVQLVISLYHAWEGGTPLLDVLKSPVYLGLVVVLMITLILIIFSFYVESQKVEKDEKDIETIKSNTEMMIDFFKIRRKRDVERRRSKKDKQRHKYDDSDSL